MLAKWVDSTQQEFLVQIMVSGIDQIGLVNEVTKVISEDMHVNMKGLNFETDGGLFTGKIKVVVKNNTLIKKLIERLNKINGIDKVIRV